MSKKYIELEQAIKKIGLIGNLADFIKDVICDELTELPTIEVSEEELKGCDKVDKRFSEDCISRTWLWKNYQTVCENVICSECPFDKDKTAILLPEDVVADELRERPLLFRLMSDDCRLADFMMNAPSVVPTAYNLSAVEDCISRAEVLSIISDCQDLNDKAKYNTLAEVFNKVLDAPSVVPSRAEGEWINKQEKYQMAECSNCKKVTMHEMWGDKLVYYDYCPNCGAKMRLE